MWNLELFSLVYRSGVRRMPHNAKVHYNYANFLKDSGDVDLAIHHYRTTLRYNIANLKWFYLKLIIHTSN